MKRFFIITGFTVVFVGAALMTLFVKTTTANADIAAGNQVGLKKDKSGKTVVSTLNEQALRDIAATTGAQYYPATADGSELDALAAQLNSLQKGDTLARSETVQRSEQFQWFLAPALLMLIAAELIPDRKSGRRSISAPVSHAARSNGGAQ